MVNKHSFYFMSTDASYFIPSTYRYITEHKVMFMFIQLRNESYTTQRKKGHVTFIPKQEDLYISSFTRLNQV